jgi:hypothetical protein
VFGVRSVPASDGNIHPCANPGAFAAASRVRCSRRTSASSGSTGITLGARFLRDTGASSPRTCLRRTCNTALSSSQSSHFSADAWQNRSPVNASNVTIAW